jgi:hypothetical protein
MADRTAFDSLRGLVLSAAELKTMTSRSGTPAWPDALVEEFLSFFDNLIALANLLDIEINQKLEEVPTDFSDGTIPFVEDGFLAENNSKLFWDNVNLFLKVEGDILGKNRSKQYFFSGF